MRRLTRGGAAVRAGLVAVLAAAVLAPEGSTGAAAQTTTTAAPALPTIALSFTDDKSTPITSISERRTHRVRVVATASEAASEAVNVSVTVGAEGGTADEHDDYTTTTRDSVTVTIAAGSTAGSSGDIEIYLWKDHAVEGDETIRFTAGAVSGYQAIPAADLVVDDYEDNGINIISVSPATVVEGTSETVTVTAGFRGAWQSTLTADTDVTLTISSGDGPNAAELGPNGDFTTDAKGNQTTLTIPAGEDIGRATFTLTAAADTDNDEYIEKGKITGTASVGGSTVDADGAVIGIIDAGFGVRLTIDADAETPGVQSSLVEDAGEVTVRVTASLASGTAPSGGLMIGLKAYGVSASNRFNDIYKRYEGPSSFETGDDIWIIYPSGQSPPPLPGYGLAVRIPHNESSGSAEMTLVMHDDRVAEDVETVRFRGRVKGDTYKVVDAQISLIDNDGASSGGGTPPGPGSGNGDGGSGGGTPPGGGGAQALPTIALSFTDDKSTPITSISEDDGWQMVRVVATASEAAAEAVNVPVTVGAEGGTADKGSSWDLDNDYSTTTDSVTVTIAAGSTAGSSGDIKITFTEDYLLEGDETIRFAAGAVSGYQAIPAADLVVDDYSDDLIILDEVSPATVVEGTSETVTVTAGFDAGWSTLTADTDVTLTISSGDGPNAATLGPNGDFTTDAKGNQTTLTIPAGAVSGSATFTLTAAADTDNEQSVEWGKITGTASVGGSTVEVLWNRIGIVNTDFGVHLTIDADTDAPGVQSSLAEDAGKVTVRVTAALASGTAPSGGLTIGLNAYGVSASQRLNGADVRYEGPSSFEAGDDVWIIYPSGQSPPPLPGYGLAVRIPHNESSGSAEMTLVVHDDRVAEGVETVRFEGRVQGDAYKVVDANMNIIDNDGAPELPAPVCTVEPCGAVPAGGGGGVPPPSGGGGSGGGGVPPPGGGGGSGGGGVPPPGGAAPEPPAPVCEGRFCDEDGSVHQTNTERIAQWQITHGCSAADPTLFCPGADITRRQMAAFLYRAVSQRRTIQTPPSAELTDVAADAWFRTYADWVISIGAFTAPEGVFDPGGVVTRADMAVMMIAAFPHLEAAAEPEGLFQDAQGADPAVVRAIEGMYKSGVTRGCSTDPLNYCPDQPVTRAQMASFFVRAIELAPAP